MIGESARSRHARADLIRLEAERLIAEAECRPRPPLDRLNAINAELGVLVDSMREIRREQLLEQVDRPKERRRGWLSRLWRAL